MGRLKRMRTSNITTADSRRNRKLAAYKGIVNRSMTPLRTSNLQSCLPKSDASKWLSPVSESQYALARSIKARGIRCRSSGVLSKDFETPSAKDPSQDSTSMVMPSGVSSFLLNCMDSELETDETFPSIETLRKADCYDEGTGLNSEDKILHRLVKNSTLLDFSHAVNIAMQQPPNISSILDLSPGVDGQPGKELFSLSPQLMSPPGSLPMVCSCEEMTLSKHTSGGEITIGADEWTPVTKRVVAFSPVVKKRPQSQALDVCELRRKTSRMRTLLVDLQVPSSETAKFFDFTNECQMKAFFQKLNLIYDFQFPLKPVNET